MKKIILFILVVVSFSSCIKKDAIKYDPNLSGTWVSYEDNIYSWLIITSDGQGTFASTESSESDTQGQVKYSLFEKKMWIGSKKFKVVEWWTGKLDGTSEIKTKDYTNRMDTTYGVDYKMVLKTSAFSSNRTITFYKIKE